MPSLVSLKEDWDPIKHITVESIKENGHMTKFCLMVPLGYCIAIRMHVVHSSAIIALTMFVAVGFTLYIICTSGIGIAV